MCSGDSGYAEKDVKQAVNIHFSSMSYFIYQSTNRMMIRTRLLMD